MYHILMGLCKKNVTPLLTHWSYVFLAQSHRYQNISVDNSMILALNLHSHGMVLKIWATHTPSGDQGPDSI